MDTHADLKPDLSRSSGVSRYVQLATLFRRWIVSGQWVPGGQIPTVDELSAQYGVARATIRQALGILESERLITRHRAKGTFVTEQVKQHLWLDMMTNWRGVMNAREGATIDILARDDAAPLPQRLHDLGVPADGYHRLRRRHSRDGLVFLVADVFIEAEFHRCIPPDALTTTTAMRLTAYLPWQVGRAQQTITIATADLETAPLLNIPLNAPVCLVDRSITDEADRLVLLSKGVYRGDVVRLDMRLK